MQEICSFDVYDKDRDYQAARCIQLFKIRPSIKKLSEHYQLAKMKLAYFPNG